MDRTKTIRSSALVATALLAAGLLCAGGCGVLPGSAPPGRVVPADGEVTVGDIMWRVLYVRRTPYVDRRFAGATRAKGVFLVINMRAERQSRAGAITSKPLSLVDTKNREFVVDKLGRLAIDESGLEPLSASRISPKTPIEGWIAFDVARDASGLRLKVLDLEGAGDDYAYIKLP